MRISLFGTGFVGRALARELSGRGHEVTAVARHPADPATIGGSVHDPALVSQVTVRADVVVSALPPVDDAGGLPTSTAVLAAAAGSARLVVVGSSAHLPTSPGGSRLADAPDFPEWLGPRVTAHERTLALLRSTPAPLDWLYLAPAAEFGPHVRSSRTGRYRTSTAGQVTDPAGRSWVGVEDYALALADELERPTVHRGVLVVGYGTERSS